MKRFFDIFLALVAIIVTLPFWLILMPLILLTQGWPIFFTQTRVGLRGQTFRLFKFRTMRSSRAGQLITVAGDARITPLGAWLRRLKIDELPQLLNVLRGEMSFVGPRPEVLHYVNMYSDDQRRVLLLKPGITDPASLNFFNESDVLKEQNDPEDYYVRVLMPEKIRLNLVYGQSANFMTDLWLIGLTVLRVFGIRIAPLKRAREI